MTATSPKDVTAAVVAHHLRLFGVSATNKKPTGSGGRVTVLLRPSAGVLADLGITVIDEVPDPSQVRFPTLGSHPWSQVRTLHALDVYHCMQPHDVVATDGQGRACWLARRHPQGVTLIVGTDLGGDLVRYRQGDPARAATPQTGALWGIPGERPMYLFDEQIPPGGEHDRPADWWAMALASTLAELIGQPLQPLLPNAAPGVVVVTGDDDQAYLEKYREQLNLLEGLPITYFLHPLTKHTTQTLAAMSGHHRVEFGLHPDALDDPGRYADLFREQGSWFRRLTGKAPAMVRNHGFLNEGYWGHLPVWLEQGVRISANLPGIDGRVLNGSLLPARMAWKSELTDHWSILTAIGDGVRFALGMDGPQSARCVLDAGLRIGHSGLPGVVVINLHPQNAAETTDMHEAARQLAEVQGFLAMTLSECVDWFAARDRDPQADATVWVGSA